MQHNGVTLRLRIGGGLNGRNLGRELLVLVSIELHPRLHSRLYLADIFFVHLAADVILARRNGEKFIVLGHQLAVDCLDVGQKSIDRRFDFGIFHLRLEFFHYLPGLLKASVALNSFCFDDAAQAIGLAFCFLIIDRGDISGGDNSFESLQIIFGCL